MSSQAKPSGAVRTGPFHDAGIVAGTMAAVVAVGIAVVAGIQPWEPDPGSVLPAPTWPVPGEPTPTGGGPAGGPSTGGDLPPAPARPALSDATSHSPTRSPAPSPATAAAGTGQQPRNATAQVSPSEMTLSIEAESAPVSGRLRIDRLPGTSGGAVVRHIGKDPERRLRFAPVTVPQDATYELTVYCLGRPRRQAVLTVNAVPAATVECPRSARGAVAAVTVVLALPAGVSTIEYGNDRDWAPDLDRIVLVRARR